MQRIHPRASHAFALVCLATLGSTAVRCAFAAPIPAGWTCGPGNIYPYVGIGGTSNCGSDGADGSVPLSPSGDSSYQYVSTYDSTGVAPLPTGKIGTPPSDETNGSTLATTDFTVTGGTDLSFYFDYLTSDGDGKNPYDYAWAELFNADNVPVATLFTIRTQPANMVPGAGLPAPLATFTPGTVPFDPGHTNDVFSPLGPISSGGCYLDANECGSTGWVLANYVIPTDGTYYLEIGVTNWDDTYSQSALAIDGASLDGNSILAPAASPTPEPSSLVLLGTGLLGLVSAAKRRLHV